MSQQSAKGNPASRRMSNAKRKERRERCWRNGQKRKEAVRTRVAEAEARNAATIGAGEYTPWQLACNARALRRASDPDVQKRRHRRIAA